MNVRLSDNAKNIMKDKGLVREIINAIQSNKTDLNEGRKVVVDGKVTLEMVSSTTAKDCNKPESR